MCKNSSSPQWISLELALSHEAADSVANYLHEQGAAGLVLEDDGPTTQRITAYFHESRGTEVQEALEGHLDVLADCFAGFERPVVRVEPVESANWAVAWKDAFTSIPVGKRLMVTPPWLEPDPEGRELIIIEPAEAFGTGTHETTQGCLVLLEQAMEQLPSERPGVLDVGCGSGILGIAAVKLGAVPVRGIDSDPVAVASAQENARLNRVEGRLDLVCAEVTDLSEPADIVLANLDARTLETHGSLLSRLAKRYLIIAGVTTEDWDRVKQGFLDGGLDLVTEMVGPEWACGMFAA